VYRTLAERRRQMGVGARTHCDIIVHVDAAAGRVLAIGGNVRGTVGLKAFPTTRTRGILRIVDPGAESSAPPIFAHLSLRSSYAMADPFATTPAVQALSCSGAGEASTWRTATALMPTAGTTCGPWPAPGGRAIINTRCPTPLALPPTSFGSSPTIIGGS
jgi:hypothetical protein